VLAKSNIIMDNKQKRAYFISNEADLDLDYNYDYEDVSTGVERQMAEIMQIETGESKSNTAKKNGIVNVPEGKDGNRKGMEGFSSNMSQGEYEECVRAAKEYIHAGDIFQVVLSQRLETDFDGDGNCNGDYFGVYRNLSEINPSPYMYFLDFGERKVIGASPEMLVRVEGNRIETCPIAGTRGRGRNERDDRRLEEEMLRDEKERAEHLMLVDLARNDVGKVSKFGSVRVKRFMYAEKYSHVQHIVSEVIGELREDKSEYDVLRATFPAGTVSGAPKVRAMEIIEEMEPTRRGIYAGCVGYFSFNHNVDTAITIRTGVFEGAKAYVQAGAGIVADSDPTREYYETMSKCAALLECMSGGGGL
jgi:anthranilate synthase component 1